MGKLFPGLAIWFREPQRDGSCKDVPAVILWAEDGVAFVIVARGTSQIHDRAGFAGDGALSFGPHDIVGKRLGLSKTTRFRRDDVKRVRADQIVKRCSMLPRGEWQKLSALTQASVETLALSIRADTITTLAKPRRQADESSNER